jgi:hypothetical protein
MLSTGGKHIRDMFTEVDLEKHYAEAYRPLSGVEHSDATAYVPMQMSMEQTNQDALRNTERYERSRLFAERISVFRRDFQAV